MFIMTPRMSACLKFITAYWAERDYAPSYDEIKDGLGAKSKGTVSALVTKLEERGYIERTPNLDRSIRVLPSRQPPAAPGAV